MARWNLEGYEFNKWLKANKDNLRLIVAGAVGLIAASVDLLPPEWKVVGGAVAASVSKWALDGFDYWISK